MSRKTITVPVGDGGQGNGFAVSLAQLLAVRARTLALAEPLSEADASAQSMEDCSPAKWHLAHTTWFFETFLLPKALPGFAPFNPAWGVLFNSYYEAAGPRHARGKRGLLTRPSLAEVREWRARTDEALALAWPRIESDPDLRDLATLGVAHEEQHQELLLTDILHLFAQNPLEPIYAPDAPLPPAHGEARRLSRPGGIVEIGAGGPGFAFDAERPRHQALLRPYRISSACVSNAEWRSFMADGGYDDPLLWMADGWTLARREGWRAPLYWDRRDGDWTVMTLRGRMPIEDQSPVSHISWYEADAFARWAGKRLPTEAEWEAAALAEPDFAQADGAVWQWTQSAFSPYPGFRPATGAVGEYNGKFMVGQFILRGGSCVTPPMHSRPSYRNFFYPHQRWQFSGLRLAEDA